jgi:hypothetical protein
MAGSLAFTRYEVDFKRTFSAMTATPPRFAATPALLSHRHSPGVHPARGGVSGRDNLAIFVARFLHVRHLRSVP